MPDDEPTAGKRTITITPEFILMAIHQNDTQFEIPEDACVLGLERETRSWCFDVLLESEQWDHGGMEGEAVPEIGTDDDE